MLYILLLHDCHNSVFKKKLLPKISCFQKNGEKNQNLPKTVQQQLQKHQAEKTKKKPFFWKYTKTLTEMHLSLLSFHICVQGGASYLPCGCNFLFLPGGRHVLVGLWLCKFFWVFFQFWGVAPMLLSMSFYVTEKYPLLLTHFWGRQDWLSLSLNSVCVVRQFMMHVLTLFCYMWILWPSKVSCWPPKILKWGSCWLPVSSSRRKPWYWCLIEPSMTLSTTSTELLIFLRPPLIGWYVIISRSGLCKNQIVVFKIKITVQVQNLIESSCILYLLYHWCLYNQTRCADLLL